MNSTRALQFGPSLVMAALPALLWRVPATRADELQVPSQYATIQKAIDAAKTGDVIVVEAGVYAETGFVDCTFAGKGIVIRSSGGPGSCVIDLSKTFAGWKLVSGEPVGTAIEGIEFRKLPAGQTALQCAAASHLTLRNCSFVSNKGGLAPALQVSQDANVTAIDCLFAGNKAPYAGAVSVQNATLRMQHCRFSANVAGYNYSSFAGALYAEASTVHLANCRFDRNFAVLNASCIAAVQSTLVVTNCVFHDNHVENAAYSSVLFGDSGPTSLRSCVFSRNSSTSGYNQLWSGSVSASGCIVWDNDPQQLWPSPATYTCTPSPWPGVGNISADPLFIDPDSGDFRLSPGSPCIDAGDNTALLPDTLDLDGDGNTTEPTPIDMAGFPRRLDDPDTPDTGKGAPPIVDMGAYEFTGCYGDLNNDKVIDQADLAFVLAAYGTCLGQPGYNPAANLFVIGASANCVDQRDLGLFLQLYGTACR